MDEGNVRMGCMGAHVHKSTPCDLCVRGLCVGVSVKVYTCVSVCKYVHV